MPASMQPSDPHAKTNEMIRRRDELMRTRHIDQGKAMALLRRMDPELCDAACQEQTENRRADRRAA